MARSGISLMVDFKGIVVLRHAVEFSGALRLRGNITLEF